MKTIGKLFIALLLAWITGLFVILLVLYFGNGGADFTLTDFTGFGVLFAVGSGLLLLTLHVPILFMLKGRAARPSMYPLFSGLLLNIPAFIFFAMLIGRKMSAPEALGFMLTFLAAGVVFGLVFAKAVKSRTRQALEFKL